MSHVKAPTDVPWSDAAMHQPSQRPSIFEVSLVPEPPCLFLELRGELDLYTAKQMPRDPYSSRPDLTTVLVDLSELAFCDVAGLSALLTFRRLHEAQGRTVSIVGAKPLIQRLMRLCGVRDRQPVARPARPTLV
jgi:anti-anti-sigma factor